MSRLHEALKRSTGGDAPIVPPEAGTPSAETAQNGQAAFSVPWTLEARGDDAPAGDAGIFSDRTAPASPGGRQPGRGSRPAAWFGGGDAATAEKLVGTELAADRRSLGVATEQYRKLAAALHHAQAARGLKLVMVTSARPGEGKSLTAANLAITLSESYQRRVLLMDGDLRRPCLHEIFGVPNTAGLSDGLSRVSESGLPAVEISPRLFVLTSGRPVSDPTRALTSEDMRRVLDDARALYDWTIVDTPPVGLLTDAKLLAGMVDAVILVVEAETTPYPDLLRAADTIGRDRLMGVVLNRLRQVPEMSNYYASYYRRAARRGA